VSGGSAGEPVVLRTTSADGTRDVAAKVASVCAAGDVVLLIGELGAGKTAFAQGFAAALGVTGPVTSPTFTLVRQYACGPGAPVETLIHADVYRTGSLSEVVDLGLAELVEERAIALVEWGDMAAPALGEDALVVTLALPLDPAAPATERTLRIEGRGRWADRLTQVAGTLSERQGAR
jgi:tRNA threonylcarbamoyladenosine biosynthesis protein TsaE